MVAESPDDESLMGRIKAGDSLAFATLVRRHNEKYYRLAYRYTVKREEAEDIVQSAFIKLWENPNLWNPERGVRFTTWFYRIVINLCLDGKKKHTEASVSEFLEVADENPDPESRIASREKLRFLKREISDLPPNQKTALILCFYEELSHGEAARVMNTSVSALRSLLARAKTTLKRKTDEYF